MPRDVRPDPRAGGRAACVACVAAFLLPLLWPAFACAARGDASVAEGSPSETILLIEAPHDPTAKRIGAELTALGFDVKTVEEPRVTGAAVTLAEIALLSRTVDAAATVGVDLGTGETRVWTVDRASGEVALRAVLAIDPEPAIGALRAVEALRTLLRRVQSRAAPAAPPSPLPAERDVVLRAAVAPTGTRSLPPSLGASFGPALAASRGNFGSSVQGLVALHWLIRPRWGIEVVGVAPITSATASESEGTASLTLGMAAAGFHWRPLAARWCLFDSGAGIGAALLHTEASPHAGFLGRTRDTFVASPFVRMGYSVSLAPLVSALWLRVDLAAAVALPRPAFLIAERTLSSWGWPLVLGSVGVEIAVR